MMLDAKTKLQTATDSAALAAAAQYGNGNADWVATAQKYLEGNKPDNMSGNPLTVDVTLNTTDRTVTVKAKGRVNSAFGSIMGIGSGQGSAENQGSSETPDTVNAAATVSLPVFSDFHKGEIILVVDYSYSMTEYVDGVRKYISMRNQVNKLINELTQNGANQDVKIGLVPFSEYVRVTMPNNYFNGQTSSSSATRCIEDRRYPYNISYSTPTTSPSSNNPQKWNYFNNTTCNKYSTNGVVVRPMTTNHAGTISQMNTMYPIGNTHISLGMEMAFHMLTPNAPFTDTVPLGTEDTLKAVVLLTDGAQTSGGYGPSNTWGVPQAEANLTSICNNMKSAGIRVVTVSFDLNDAQNSMSEQRLANCASAPEYYFNVETNSQLANAFGVIKNQLAANMYLKK